MNNDKPRNPERKRVRMFEPLRWGGLPDFWVYLIGAVLVTMAVAVGGAWLLVKLGVQ